MRVLYAILGGVALLVLVRMSVFTVDPTEFVYLTQFGAPVAIYDGGARDSDAGLHFRWPWPIQSLQRLDRRLQYFDLPATELLTHDAEGKGVDQTLTVEAYPGQAHRRPAWRPGRGDAAERPGQHGHAAER